MADIGEASRIERQANPEELDLVLGEQGLTDRVDP
jgi:hypothetical protein